MASVTRLKPWTPPCTCGCDPCECDHKPPGPPVCVPEWGGDLLKCWNQIATLKKIIAEIMDEIGVPDKRIKHGPIRGVVDGSVAAPGEVGEYLVFHQDNNFAGTDGVWETQVAAFAILPPGDWDVTGSCIWTFACRGGIMTVANEPAGQRMPWLGEWDAGANDPMSLMTLTSPAIGFSVSVPTLIPVQLQTLGSGTAGATSFCISARRMR